MSCVEMGGDVGGGGGGAVSCRFGGVCFVAEGKKGKWRRRGSTTMSYINYYWRNYQRNIFVCQSVGNSVGISDMSMYDFLYLNLIVISSIKASTKNYMSLCFLIFFKILFILIRILSVFTDKNIPLINTNRNGDRINSTNNYYLKISTKYFHRWFCLFCISRYEMTCPRAATGL